MQFTKQFMQHIKAMVPCPKRAHNLKDTKEHQNKWHACGRSQDPFHNDGFCAFQKPAYAYNPWMLLYTEWMRISALLSLRWMKGWETR